MIGTRAGSLGAAPATASGSFTVIPLELRLQTVPALAGVTFTVDGEDHTTDASGSVAVPIAGAGSHRVAVQAGSDRPDVHVQFAHWFDQDPSPGRVLRVFVSRGGNVFLDFCTDYRKCPFTSVIFSADRSKFGDLSTLGGRDVEIHGFITVYQGRAEVVIRDAQQIRVSP